MKLLTAALTATAKNLGAKMAEANRQKPLTPLQQSLFALQDTAYRDFHARLMPTVPKQTVIGVRTPQLRRFAVKFSAQPEAEAFLQQLPHDYYEENNLHAFLIERLQDYDCCIAALNRFLPFVNNWATCDLMRPKAFRGNLQRLALQVPVWLGSTHSYTVRFGIVTLLTWFLGPEFSLQHPAMVAAAVQDDYYINMAAAWYFATALAKQWDAVLPYFTQNRLPTPTHNKALQKAVESRRLSLAQKDFLKTLRRREK